MRRIFLAVLVASALSVVAAPAGASGGSLPSRVAGGTGAGALLLNTDQAKVARAVAGPPKWTTVTKGCLALAKDTLSVDEKGGPSNKALVTAWRSMLATTLGYADTCVIWAQSSGAKKAGLVSSQQTKMAAAVTAWNLAVATGGASSPPPTTVLTPQGGTPSPTTTTTTAPLTEGQFQAQCTDLMPYAQLLQGANDGQSDCVTEQGQVTQYDSSTGTGTMLVSVTNAGGGNWENLVALNLADAAQASGIGQNDIVQFWGPISGTATLTDSSGAVSTVPLVDATYLTLVATGTPGG